MKGTKMIETIKQMQIELESIKTKLGQLLSLANLQNNPFNIDRDGYIAWNKGDGIPPFPRGTMINHSNDWPDEDPVKYDLHYFDWHAENAGHKGYRVVSIPHAKMIDFRGCGWRMPEELKGNELIYFYPKIAPGFGYEVSEKLHGPVKAKDVVWWNDTQQVVYWYAVPAL